MHSGLTVASVTCGFFLQRFHVAEDPVAGGSDEGVLRSASLHDSFILMTGVPFLPKPFGPAALARKVKEVLDNR
jgi:hypothetical protein